MKQSLVCAAAAILIAACADQPTEPLPELGISWLEWPTAVTPGQRGELHISGRGWCTYAPVYSVALRNNEVQISARTVRSSSPCYERSNGYGSGAGYDTVLPLPRLPGTPGQYTVPIRAPMQRGAFYLVASADALERSVRVVGYVELRATPDTTTQLAGFVLLRGDSAAGCWVAQPHSQWPQPEFAFSRPVPLTPLGYRSGFVTGRLLRATPDICGQPLAIDASELTVDATPY